MADEVLLDTNIILRFLRGDNEVQYTEARRLFEQATAGKIRLLLPSLVVAEVVWTLEGFYHTSRRYIAEVLEALFATPNVILFEPRVIPRATELFAAHAVDFVDAYLVSLAEETKTTRLATFNKKHFRRFPQLKLIP